MTILIVDYDDWLENDFLLNISTCKIFEWSEVSEQRTQAVLYKLDYRNANIGFTRPN